MRVKPAAPKPLTTTSALIAKNGAPVADDPWIFLADDEPAPAVGDIVVSVKRLLAECESLARAHKGHRVGVKIASSEAVEEIAVYAPQLSLIAVEFPGFRDGRGYSTARLLRERYHYSGELRAVGDVLPDQVFFMLRCGFDSFVLKASDPVAAFARAASTFTQVYQPAADGRATALDLRRKKTASPETAP